jgi:hypothetical protein
VTTSLCKLTNCLWSCFERFLLGSVDEVTDGVKGRRNIRSILSDDELSEMSQLAKKEEKERVTRLKEHTKTVVS